MKGCVRGQNECYHKDAKAPPISGKGMAFTTNDLRGHVLDSSTKRVGFVLQVLFGQSKVRDGDVSIGIKEETKKKELQCLASSCHHFLTSLVSSLGR